jgi:hypothetical protein
MKKNDEDLLKYVEKVMNEDRFFDEVKMALSAGYVAAYIFMQKGDKGRAQKVAAALGDLARECSPIIKKTMSLIDEYYKAGEKA